ncbi:IPT/TIG domain-containing protein [Blastococcus fimeti]|nr:IPT/TIG domain-containing protein [Blastococcus fimeti]
MKSKRIQALVLVSALAFGYAGAAAYSAYAAPSLPPLPVASDLGPGDGLTRYVVTAASGSDQAALLAGLEAVDGVAHAQPLDDVRALVAVDGVPADELAAVPGAAGVELSASGTVFGELTDPYAVHYGWNLENTGTNAYQQSATADADVDATEGWTGGTGERMVVAVVDTGFDSDHPDLAGSLWTNPRQSCGPTDQDGNGLAGDCHGWNFYTNSADIDNGDLGTHGANVAGTAGARANNGEGSAGVAPSVSIMPLVIGGGKEVNATLGAKAIRYAVDNGADVINASWGCACTGWPLEDLRSAIAYAAAQDVLVVAAAGNDSLSRDTSPYYPASYTSENLITVGSSTAADTVAAHSAYGATSVDLFAPGEKVATTGNHGDYLVVSGTSIAAPHVAAAVALYRARMPDATFAELKQALLDDADRKAAFAGRSVTGGRLTLRHLSGAPAETVRYAFTSMTAPAGTVTPRIGVSGSATAGRYSVAVGLGMEHEGEIWALADKPVTLGGATSTTDDTGSAVFDLGMLAKLDGLGLAPSVPLADGRYVLTVQLLRDGNPVGRPSAAPLLVRTSAPGSGGGGTNPGTSPGTTPGTTPGGGSGGGTAPGGTSPGGGTPGTPTPTTPSTPGGPQPGGSTPGGGTTPSTPTPAPGTPAPTTPGTPAPGTPAPGSPAPGTPAPGAPGTPAPGAGGTSPGGSTPGTTTPPGSGGGGSTPTTPTTPGNGTTTYPSVGEFRITSLSPNTVSVSGGTLVTITGTALPVGAWVRIGDTAQARVVASSATRVQFEAPARTAGVYDVTVFAPDNRSTVLEDALAYRTDAPSGGGTSPGTSPGGGTSPGPGTTPPPGTTPAPGTPADPGTGSGPVAVTGPNGERLVRSATFAALRGIWSINCSASCTGVAI